MTDQILPLIGINGDTAETLMNNAREASNAIDDAIRAMQAAMPSGRNYRSPEEYRAVRAAHQRHLVELQKISDAQMELARYALDVSRGEF